MLACWMTGPSALGSENGTPSSMMSAPPFSMASMRGTVASTVGKPAVRKVTNALGSAPLERACGNGGSLSVSLLAARCRAYDQCTAPIATKSSSRETI